MHDKHTANSRKKNGNKNKQENLRSGSTDFFRLRHFVVKGLWFTVAMSRFCLHNAPALQNGLATKFFLQNGGRVMHPLLILQNGVHTTSVSTKWVWDR